jgi:purine-nucleoside phosphorylase
MDGLFEQIEIARAFLEPYQDDSYAIGIILGTGLGTLTKDMVIHHRIPYQDIPHFPVSTVESHAGELLFATLNHVPVIALAGRFHYYEGYSAAELAFPIRVLKSLGINTLLISNAAGSTRADLEAGDIVLIKDHINLHPDNPLRGRNDDRLGIRFPDMMHAYSPSLRSITKALGSDLGIELKEGVYVGLQGPNLETPAEYNFINIIGGDLVGMSTVPEVLVARHANMEVLAISVVSNKCFPIDSLTETTLEEVIEVVEQASNKLTKLVFNLVNKLV